MSFVLDTLWNTIHEQTLNCTRYSTCEMLVTASGIYSLGVETTGEEGPAIESRTVTYSLAHILSHMNHRTSHAPLPPPVLDTDVSLTATV